MVQIFIQLSVNQTLCYLQNCSAITTEPKVNCDVVVCSVISQKHKITISCFCCTGCSSEFIFEVKTYLSHTVYRHLHSCLVQNQIVLSEITAAKLLYSFGYNSWLPFAKSTVLCVAKCWVLVFFFLNSSQLKHKQINQ